MTTPRIVDEDPGDGITASGLSPTLERLIRDPCSFPREERFRLLAEWGFMPDEDDECEGQ